MSAPIDDGGPAFPVEGFSPNLGSIIRSSGMTMRDWFAGQLQIDDRLVKCVRAMDDRALEVFGSDMTRFALHPNLEREEHITETPFPLPEATAWDAMNEIQKVRRRLELEARAIAVVRYMQADAMLAERKRGGVS